MRYVITVCAALALTVSLVHGAIDGNARSVASPRELHARALDIKPKSVERSTSSTSWIGDRAKVLPNRSWPLQTDEGARVVLVQAPEEKHEPPAPGPFAGLAEQVRSAK